MSLLSSVEWTVLTTESPQIKHPCRRCGAISSFASTGKFRLNANGSRLDAWLIYKCLACDNRWNLSLFERRPVGNIPRDLLVSLQENDVSLAHRIASNPLANSACVASGHGPEFSITKRLQVRTSENGSQSNLTILNPHKCPVRMDKVLAQGLSLSRGVVHELAEEGAIYLPLCSGKAMKRPIKERTVVGIRSTQCTRVSDLNYRLMNFPKME
ncbi:DUF1062 domain-containing protein [Roseibium album]|uniref:DUF1062 domain-containing protein n=1 Tax=Roseibium album TaxID=311410 RepID=UPI0032991661